jgi:hypothetical protein
MSVKTRSLDKVIPFPSLINPITGAVIQPGVTRRWTGRQYTVSVGHRKSRNGTYNEGGPFFTYLTGVGLTPSFVSASNASGTRSYKGPVVCAGVPNTMGSVPTPSTDHSHLDPYGAEAISRIDPTDPNAEAGVALGEILNDRRIPIPGIESWRRRTQVAKAAGSEYLSAVFGWLPLVDEMKNVSQSITDGNTIMKHYGDNAGTRVHREYTFDPIETSETQTFAPVHPIYGGGTSPEISAPSAPTRTRTKSTRRWFSGSFTYHAPSDRTSFQKCLGIGSEADKLLGLSLTPDIVWELTPWSWAVDWFSNAGDVINNVTSMKLAGLVMSYGFIMEESITKDVYTQTGRFFRKGKEFTVPLTAHATSVTKRRGVANPFGFGVKWEGLSPSQLAITAALGITRLR